jgi:NDP-sugar pyrophosphorylase family protein
MARNKNFITSPHHVVIEESNDLVTVVLLCENAGHRMKSYGPTPLAKIGNTTLIDLQISAIKRVLKNFELIICGGFEAEKVIKHIRENMKKKTKRLTLALP